jgi:hypothetical protein
VKRVPGAFVKPAGNGTGCGVVTPTSITTLNEPSGWRFQIDA